MKQSYADQCLERAEKATPGPWRVERVCHDDGEIAYEVNDKHHLVAFYESNFEKPMKAKFNAELYAHSRTDVVELATRLKKAISYIRYLDRDSKSGSMIADELEATPEVKE